MNISQDEYLKALDIVERYHKQIRLKSETTQEDNIYKRFMNELDPDQGIGEVNIERVIGTQRLLVTLIHPEQTLMYQNHIRTLSGDNPLCDREHIELFYGSEVPKRIIHRYRL